MDQTKDPIANGDSANHHSADHKAPEEPHAPHAIENIEAAQSKLEKTSKITNRSCDMENHFDSDSEKFDHNAAHVHANGTDNGVAGHKAHSENQRASLSVDDKMNEEYHEKVEALEELHDKEKLIKEDILKEAQRIGFDLQIDEKILPPSIDFNYMTSDNLDQPPTLAPNNSVAISCAQFDPNVLQAPIAGKVTKQAQEGENKVFIFGSAECDQFYINDDVFESKRPVEIPFFAQHGIKIVKITCGAQHTAILDQEGKVYTWGNADDGCLGRTVTDKSTVPGLVELDEPVDLLTSGESHTICANSKSGSYYFWGTLKSALSGKLASSPLPKKVSDYSIKRKGISDLKSGYNHIVMLSGSKVYSWGDNDTGALGTAFRQGKTATKVDEPRSLTLKGITRIFTGGNHSFFIDKKDRVFACGLNNYAQLGIEPAEDSNIIALPVEIPGLVGKWIKDIRGGEHHTLILMNNGWLFGAGRNDDGQIGTFDHSIKIGGFTKLSHTPMANSIATSHHFNYAQDAEMENFYSWGMGFSYVLGNGDEESIDEAYKINNTKFFKDSFPSYLDLGHSHVVYTVNKLGSEKVLAESLENHKREYTRSRSRKQTKKVPQ